MKNLLLGLFVCLAGPLSAYQENPLAEQLEAKFREFILWEGDDYEEGEEFKVDQLSLDDKGHCTDLRFRYIYESDILGSIDEFGLEFHESVDELSQTADTNFVQNPVRLWRSTKYSEKDPIVNLGNELLECLVDDIPAALISERLQEELELEGIRQTEQWQAWIAGEISTADFDACGWESRPLVNKVLSNKPLVKYALELNFEGEEVEIIRWVVDDQGMLLEIEWTTTNLDPEYPDVQDFWRADRHTWTTANYKSFPPAGMDLAGADDLLAYILNLELNEESIEDLSNLLLFWA